MSLVLMIAGVWVALSVLALVVMSVIGRASSSADAQADRDAIRLKSFADGLRLATPDASPESDDTSVCPTCASLVIGAFDGDPCPACGTAVTELPRIRPSVVGGRRGHTRRVV